MNYYHGSPVGEIIEGGLMTSDCEYAAFIKSRFPEIWNGLDNK